MLPVRSLRWRGVGSLRRLRGSRSSEYAKTPTQTSKRVSFGSVGLDQLKVLLIKLRISARNIPT